LLIVYFQLLIELLFLRTFKFYSRDLIRLWRMRSTR